MDIQNNYQPSVAVIIPTYNRWPHVAEAIDSCLSQSHENVEVIVVDDASTDATADHIKIRYGDRVKLIEVRKNVQKSRARNIGLRAAESEFVCMLDSDDVFHEHSIVDRLRIFSQDPSFDGVAYGSTHYAGRKNDTDLSRHVSGDVLDAYLNDFGMLNNNAFLLRRSAMLEHGMYCDTLTNMEDRELLIRLTARLPFRYCGSVIQSVQRVDRSAGSCYCRLIRQQHVLTARLKQDVKVVERLGGRIRDVEFMESYELARARYKLKMYRQFIDEAKELFFQYPTHIRGNRRFRRRVLAAYLLKYFVRPVTPLFQHNLRSA